MNLDDIASLVPRFRDIRVLVLGDLMLDEYLWGHVQRISPEAPVPILNLVRREYTLGGAANIAKNLQSLGVEVCVAGVVGPDITGNTILQELRQIRAESEVLEEPKRTSTRKTRLMSLEHGQQVFRFDHESTHPIGTVTQDALLIAVQGKVGSVQAIICSDYLKGTLTPRLLKMAVELGFANDLPVVVCPKGTDSAKYVGAPVVIHNERELELLSGRRIDGKQELHHAGLQMIEQFRAQSLLVTRGSEGMSLFQRTFNSVRQVDLPVVARSVYDVTGAGDTVTSVFTACIAAGADHETAARIANLAAGLVVKKRGTACVTPEEILHNNWDARLLQSVAQGD
jgi:D-beta-D-heptose 7-phosphate kinase/D-beta-D-heptose 1-phosphate adenosyltransferase